MTVQAMGLHLVPQLHDLYTATPDYFKLLGTSVPTRHEVESEVATALLDPRRHLELLLDDGEVVGCLDTKWAYPQVGDLTINLLLIRSDLQRRGYGAQAVRDLERRLPPGTTRILASVLGENAAAARFWERLGFDFAIDARPAMTWYAKAVGAGHGGSLTLAGPA